MSLHLQRQFDRLKKSILALGTLVEEAVDMSIRAAVNRDAELAQQVIDSDEKIDLMEIDVEEECLHTLALHQPVAFDLRFLVAVLKINNDLERIADLAVNIAEQTQRLSGESMPGELPFDLRGMARGVRTMLKTALDALVNVDPDLARGVRNSDRDVDAIHAETYTNVAELIRDNPSRAEQMIQYLSISRQLERIGDHCVNIADDVIYMARGDISRHRPR